MLCANPLIITLTNVIVFQVLFQQLPFFNKSTDGGPTLFETILGYSFPSLLLLGYITSIGVYAAGPVKDRFDKTRYLLNFAGQRSSSYYMGVFLGDYLIFSISSLSILILILALNITVLKEGLGWIFLAISVFGLPFIALSYTIGYIFKDPETGYKFSIIFGLLTYAIPYVLTIQFTTNWPSEGIKNVTGVIIPWISLNNSLTYIIIPTDDEKKHSAFIRIAPTLLYEIL